MEKIKEKEKESIKGNDCSLYWSLKEKLLQWPLRNNPQVQAMPRPGISDSIRVKTPNPLPFRLDLPCIQIFLLGLSSMIKIGSFNPKAIPKPKILVGLMICYSGDLVNPQTNLILSITIRYFRINGMGSLWRCLFMVLMMCLVECLARRALLQLRIMMMCLRRLLQCRSRVLPLRFLVVCFNFYLNAFSFSFFFFPRFFLIFF